MGTRKPEDIRSIALISETRYFHQHLSLDGSL